MPPIPDKQLEECMFTMGGDLMLLNKYQRTDSTAVAQRCTLAHDLNNDLAVIIGECDLLDGIITPDGAATARLKSIHAIAHRMSHRLSTRPCAEKADYECIRLEERLRAEERLAERLINAQEQERTRIARELHDDLNQQIAAISLAVGGVRRKLADTKPEARQQLEDVCDQLSRVSTTIRQMSHELHPAVLDYGDLAAALRGHCKEFSSLSGVEISFEASGTFEDMPMGIALCIYRVTQEALQNIVKHAGVTCATVHLDRCENTLQLRVSDRGKGFRSDQLPASGGLGLVSMKERVRLVRGTVELRSEPNRGTTLKVELPVNPAPLFTE